MHATRFAATAEKAGASCTNGYGIKLLFVLSFMVESS